MARNPPQDKQAILAALAPDVTRLQVRTSDGHTKWKPLADILNSDYILLNAAGQPFTMKGSPGRKATQAPATPGAPAQATGQPNQSTTVDVLAEIRKKNANIAKDPILKAAGASPESPEVLTNVLLALAEEAASLAHERRQAEEQRQPTSAISVRRIKALTAIGDTWLKRKEQVAEKGINFDAPEFKAVFSYIAETFRGAMEGARLLPEVIDTVFSKFGAAVNGPEWLAEAKSRMKKAG